MAAAGLLSGRLPATSLYRREPAGDGTVLEHVDLEAWLEAPLVPPDVHPNQLHTVSPPRILADARDALAPILFPGIE